MSRQRISRPKPMIASIDRPAANAPPTIEPAEVPAMQSIGMSFSSNARNTPTWAMPRAAPPDNASPIRGRSDSIQHHNLRTVTGRVEKRVRLRFNLCLDQGPLNLITALLQRRHDAPGSTSLKAGHVSVPVIVGNLLLTDHYEISKTKVQIFFHLQALLDDLVQLFTRQTYALKPLLKLTLRRKISRQLVARVADFFWRGHDCRQLLSLLKNETLVYQEPQRAIQILRSRIVEHGPRLQRKLPHEIGVSNQIGFDASIHSRNHLVDDLLRRTWR